MRSDDDCSSTECDSAREFATIVGNLLEDKLRPIHNALLELGQRVAIIETRVSEHDDMLRRTQTNPLLIAYAALAMSLITLGCLMAVILGAK